MEKILHFTNRYLETLDRRFLATVSLMLVLLLGVLDYLSGFEFSFSLFYLLPVALAAWYVNRDLAFLISIFSALTWLVANSLAGEIYSNPAAGYWNAASRLGFFFVVTVLIANLKRSWEHEQELARRDFLTGVANSRAFYEIAGREIRRSRRYNHPFTLAYIDVDDLKLINDQFGHATGDVVLKTIAETLRSSLRQTDLVARIGGDEFVVLLPELSQESAEVVMNKLMDRLRSEMQTNQWQITVSIGAITFLAFEHNVDEAIRLADDLMYWVKAHGKNQVEFTLVE
jgi:diguanylate cyclase (GGDEF)-like protein